MLALFVCWEFLLHIPCWLLFLIWGVSLTHPMLTWIWSGEFVLHVPCWIIFMSGVSLTHPMLALILSNDFLLHMPCWGFFLLFFLSFFFLFLFFSFFLFFFLFLLNIPCWLHFSCISHAAFICLWEAYLTHPMLASFSNLGSFSDTSLAVFILSCGIAHAASFLSGKFLLHIPCCFHFYLGNLS